MALEEGRIEIEPALLGVFVKRRGRLTVAVAREEVAVQGSGMVEETRRRLRRERSGD